MIKITDLNRLKKIKSAQQNIGTHTNYLTDILKPAIKKGNWDVFEELDIGFDENGQSLGKIKDNDAWKNLQPFFTPTATKASTLNFSLDGKVIERNIQNELKALILKMLWVSPVEHSFDSLCQTLVVLKKFAKPLLGDGLNSLSYVDVDRITSWIQREVIDIDFRREKNYAPINKLFTEGRGLPFTVGFKGVINPQTLGLTPYPALQYPVIPQRLFYQALDESENLINYLYDNLNLVEELANFLVDFEDNIYNGYAKYLHLSLSVRSVGKEVWRLDDGNQKSKNNKFKSEFKSLESPSEAEILQLLKDTQPKVHSSFYEHCYPGSTFTLGSITVTTPTQAQALLKELSGGCLWGLMARSGMRTDEAYHLHTVNGCVAEVISGQVIYLLNTSLSKTVKGMQAKQDEFVTTEIGKKAFEVLNTIHNPLRNKHTSSNAFFHKFKEGFGVIRKKSISRHAQFWFNKTLSTELELTEYDIKDLRISDPNHGFELGQKFHFSCHQLRRSFAYYLIGYELLSFPQLKQQYGHLSLAMTRHYARYASKFQKIRKRNSTSKDLHNIVYRERIKQKSQLYLKIYNKFANKERVAGGKGKDFTKRVLELGHVAFQDKTQNDMLTIEYWENVLKKGHRHIHVVAPGLYCTSRNCSLRTQVNLIECVDCKNDYIVDTVYAEAMRKEAEIFMYYDIEHGELTPQSAAESYIKITAAERIMSDLGIDYEPVSIPQEVKHLLIPHAGNTL